MKCCVMEGGVVLYDRCVCICVRCLQWGEMNWWQEWNFLLQDRKPQAVKTQSDFLTMGVKTPETC